MIEAKRLFVKYQSLYIKYQEKADHYRRVTGCETLVYSDLIARVAKRKADYYERMAEGVLV